MARLKGCKRVTWGLTGRMRDIVFRETKQGIVAAEYNKPAYSEVKANSIQAKTFGAVGRLGLDLKPMVDMGLIALMVNTYNANSQFIKKNYGVATIELDGTVKIDYTQVVVSEGSGKRLTAVAIEQDSMGGIEIRWDKTKFGADDANTMVYLGALCPTAERNMDTMAVFSLGETACSVGSKSVMTPAGWIGKTIHCYAFTKNERDVVSNSQYIGEVTMD